MQGPKIRRKEKGEREERKKIGRSSNSSNSLALNSSGASSKSWSSRFLSLTSFSTSSPIPRKRSISTSFKITAFFSREIAASNSSFLRRRRREAEEGR